MKKSSNQELTSILILIIDLLSKVVRSLDKDFMFVTMNTTTDQDANELLRGSTQVTRRKIVIGKIFYSKMIFQNILSMYCTFLKLEYEIETNIITNKYSNGGFVEFNDVDNEKIETLNLRGRPIFKSKVVNIVLSVRNCIILISLLLIIFQRIQDSNRVLEYSQKNFKIILILLFLFFNDKVTEIKLYLTSFAVELLSLLYCLSKVISEAYITGVIIHSNIIIYIYIYSIPIYRRR